MGVRGKTGRQLAVALERYPEVKIRGVGRTTTALSIPNASVSRFDWEDPSSWSDATAGIDSVYLVKPKTRDPAATVASFLQKAKSLKRLVLLSEIDAETRDEATDERKVERVIEASPTAWTILRPNWFMQNFAEPGFFLEGVRDHGEITLPAAGQKVSFVDTRDIAEVAAAAVLEPGHVSQYYTLTGPDALTFAEAVRQIGRAAGHLIHHDDPPLGDYLKTLAAKGTAQKTLDYYRRIYGCIQDGRAAVVSPDVERVTGHKPGSFSSFIEQNLPAWRR